MLFNTTILHTMQYIFYNWSFVTCHLYWKGMYLSPLCCDKIGCGSLLLEKETRDTMEDSNIAGAINGFQPHKHHQPHCRHTTCSADRQTDHIPVIWTHHGIIVAPWWTQCHFILVTWKIPIVPLGTKLSNYSMLIKGPAWMKTFHYSLAFIFYTYYYILLHHHGTLGLSSWKLLDTIWRPKQPLNWTALACTIAWQHLHWYLSSLHQHNRVIHGFESRMRIYRKNRYLIASNIDYLFHAYIINIPHHHTIV